MKYLKMSIKAPMQYYYKSGQLIVADLSAYYHTEKRPTRSTLVGMIGAACGYPRGDERLKELDQRLTFKYKVVKEGRVIVDYQIVKASSDNPFRNINGGKIADSLVKYVEYLVGYQFDVYIGGEDAEYLDMIVDAFFHPKWQPYIGKKNCPSGYPLVPQPITYDLEDEENVYDCP